MIENIHNTREIFLKTLIPIFIIWVIFFMQFNNIIDTESFETSRENGFWSIFTGPFLHGNINHLVSNTVPLIITLPILARYYKSEFIFLWIFGIIGPSLVMYSLGKTSIGISGLGYTTIWFVITAGLWSKDRTKFFISLFLCFVYGSTLRGATYLAGVGVAFEAHLAGLLIGVLAGFPALNLKKKE